ncbi:unnamed protein product [Urochloa humidicola]
MGTKQHEKRKTPEGRSPRRSRSHHGEKRRRYKISEKLRTLQQLVPGCDKCNQASTLDQTIHYMKSLQHQVQAMSFGPARPTAAAAVYPVVQRPVAMPMVAAEAPVLGAAPTMVPAFRAMIQLPHYPAAVPMVMPTAAVAPPLNPVTARSSGSAWKCGVDCQPSTMLKQ